MKLEEFAVVVCLFLIPFFPGILLGLTMNEYNQDEMKWISSVCVDKEGIYKAESNMFGSLTAHCKNGEILDYQKKSLEKRPDDAAKK